QTAPRIALALRQAVKGKAVRMAAEKKLFDWQAEAVQNIGQHDRDPLYITSFDTTRLDDVARQSWQGPVEDQARLGFAVAHHIDPDAPAPADLDADSDALARAIAADLLNAAKPLVVSGVTSGSRELMLAAANIATALRKQGAIFRSDADFRFPRVADPENPVAE
ncbi:MAG: hypothetical protein P8X98_09480, partial [Woeseiaceae bacterium]